ncbi:MAG: hypothetical protein ABL886_12665, partial [Rhodoglobus sp.]
STGNPATVTSTLIQGPTSTVTYTSTTVFDVDGTVDVNSLCVADRVDGIKDPYAVIVATYIGP